MADLEIKLLNPTIDSTNMLTSQRAELATYIYESAHKFDGFVISHGTDTTSDTAAALTYMVQGLGKPIVLTGSQLSVFEELDRTDGRGNLFSGIITATQDYGEVCVAFGNNVFRGPRVIKFDEEGFQAFMSPRTYPIGEIGIEIRPMEFRITREQGRGELRLFTDFNPKIAFLYLMSGVDPKPFLNQVNDPDVHGIVLVGFGAGNVPSTYYDGLKLAQELHKPTVVVTQCLKGRADMGIYETGSKPLELGVIPGGDMTMQAATQKLMYALGLSNAQGIPDERRVEFVQRIIHTQYGKDIDPASIAAYKKD